MLIRKQFKFEGAHIVRNCSSQRCRENIHGHSYIVEVFITSDKLDDGYMVMDFCRLDKVKEFIESFDHSYSLWQNESPDLKTFVYRYNRRVAEIPVSPSAEGYALLPMSSTKSSGIRNVSTGKEIFSFMLSGYMKRLQVMPKLFRKI